MEIKLNLVVTLSDNLKVTGVRINKPSDSFEEAASKTIAVVTPKRSKSKKDQDTIVLEDNKLVLTQKLLDKINAEPGDRLLVSFKEENGIYFPVIAKSEVFADPESGNKLTKSLTLSYRGKQREQLLIYGTKFRFEETSENSKTCKLIGDKEVKADNKVIKSNKDIVTFDSDESEDDTKKTYTRELKTPFEVTLEDEGDYEIPIDLKKLDLEGLEEINLDDETLFNLTN